MAVTLKQPKYEFTQEELEQKPGRPLYLDDPAIKSPIGSMFSGIKRLVQEPARRFVYNHLPTPSEGEAADMMAKLSSLSLSDKAKDLYNTVVKNNPTIYNDAVELANRSSISTILHKNYLKRPLSNREIELARILQLEELPDGTIRSNQPNAFGRPLTIGKYVNTHPLGYSWIKSMNEEKNIVKFKDNYDLLPSDSEWQNVLSKEGSSKKSPYYRNSDVVIRYLVDKFIGDSFPVEGVAKLSDEDMKYLKRDLINSYSEEYFKNNILEDNQRAEKQQSQEPSYAKGDSIVYMSPKDVELINRQKAEIAKTQKQPTEYENRKYLPNPIDYKDFMYGRNKEYLPNSTDYKDFMYDINKYLPKSTEEEGFMYNSDNYLNPEKGY